MSHIVIPTVTDWRHSVDFTSGTVLVDGRLAEMLHPELWTGCVAAYAHALDAHPWDYTISGNSASRINGVTDGAQGWNLASASSQYLRVSDRDNLDFGTAVLFSVSGWINTSNTGTWALLGKVNHNVAGAANRGFSFSYINSISAMRFSLFDGTNNTTYDGSTDVATGTWRHIAVVVRSRNASAGAEDCEVYVDGIAEGTLNISAIGTNANMDNALALQIGARTVSSTITDFFNGQLTDVRVHRRALTEQEIALLCQRRHIAYECRLNPRRYFVR